MRALHPDSAVVDALGGPVKLGALCGITPQAVSHWKRHGIPRASRLYLALLRPDVVKPEAPPAEPPAAKPEACGV